MIYAIYFSERMGKSCIYWRIHEPESDNWKDIQSNEPNLQSGPIMPFSNSWEFSSGHNSQESACTFLLCRYEKIWALQRIINILAATFTRKRKQQIHTNETVTWLNCCCTKKKKEKRKKKGQWKSSEMKILQYKSVNLLQLFCHAEISNQKVISTG